MDVQNKALLDLILALDRYKRLEGSYDAWDNVLDSYKEVKETIDRYIRHVENDMN
jgi:hypothetical protein